MFTFITCLTRLIFGILFIHSTISLGWFCSRTSSTTDWIIYNDPPLYQIYIPNVKYPTVEFQPAKLGPSLIERCRLTSIGSPIVEIRRSYDRVISTMGFPILVRRHLYWIRALVFLVAYWAEDEPLAAGMIVHFGIVFSKWQLVCNFCSVERRWLFNHFLVLVSNLYYHMP